MTTASTRRKQKKQTFFAIASLGKKRWYWVVWPSFEVLQRIDTDAGDINEKDHLADGYEETKADAVDQALEKAGMYGEWVDAKYAKQYHSQLSRRKRMKSNGTDTPVTSLSRIELLYQDIYNDLTDEWESVPHRVIKKTKKYVYVERHLYDPTFQIDGWSSQAAPTFRLNRQQLEEDGYTFTPLIEIDDPLFFTLPYQERLIHYAGNTPSCLRQLNLTFPATPAAVKSAYRQLVKQVHPDHGGDQDEFLALQTAYEQALQLCRYDEDDEMLV
ncbi:MAG: J domain-containing protein [Chloroflexota bacterium]